MSSRGDARLREVLEKVPREYWRAPAVPADLASLQRWLQSIAGIEVPEEYLELLRASDGAQIDNDLVFSAEDCRWQNEPLYRDARYRRHLLIGREGNVASWAYDVDARRFVISAFGSPEAVFESFESLADLIASRLESGAADANGGDG